MSADWQDGPDDDMCCLAEALDAAPELSILQLKRESVHCSAPSARTDDSHSVLYRLTSKSKSPKGVLDVGEILSASDEETERPKVEPCSLAFCVSHVAGRVHVLDAAEQPMGFNSKLADWQAFGCFQGARQVPDGFWLQRAVHTGWGSSVALSCWVRIGGGGER